MPNLIITKSCNLSCEYCFAGINKIGTKTEISLYLYLLYLKHLRISNDRQIRLLGGEPLLHSKIEELIKIGLKGKFHILIFSNLTINPKKVKKIFGGLNGKILVNININCKSFYKKDQIGNLLDNIKILQDNNIDIRLSFLVYQDEGAEKFMFDIAEKFGITKIHLKPYNYNGHINFDTNKDKYGNLFYNIIKRYGNSFKIFISCGFSKNILSKKKISELKSLYSFDLKFGCDANGGKYDINYDGKIFRCFALEDKYETGGYNLCNLYTNSYSEIKIKLNNIVDTSLNNLNCLGYIINK